jgi:hypothetical protein
VTCGIHRLCAEDAPTRCPWCEIGVQLAEVARLRDALEEIRRYPTLAPGWQDIAREALRTTSARPVAGGKDER